MLTKTSKADLRAKYKRYIEISIILSLVLLITAFKYFPEIKSDTLEREIPPELITVEDPINTIQDKKLPEPPKPETKIEVVDSDIPLDDIEFAPTDLLQPVDPVGPPKHFDDKPVVEEAPYFEAVETMPEPLLGIAELQSRVVYPELAVKTGIQGLVSVLAYVEVDGSVTKVELKKGIGMGCDEAAMKAVAETKFIPGKQRGKPVRTKVGVPVRFRIR